MITVAFNFAFFICAALLCWGAMRLIAPAQADNASNTDFYKKQIKDVEKDHALGRISDADYALFRAETGRRLLTESARMQGQMTYGGRLVVVALLILGFALGNYAYFQVGAVGYRDQPLDQRHAMAEITRTTRMPQAQATLPPPPVDPTAQISVLADRLRTILKTRPDDIEGFTHLVRVESEMGNLGAAADAQRTVLALKGPAATAQDWAFHAELLIAAADGYISPLAETSIRAALALDGAAQLPRFRLGQVYLNTGRPDITFQMWHKLLLEGPETAPYIPAIRAQIDDLALLSGRVRYQQPTPAPLAGPTQADVDAAEQMDDAARMQMIQGMVSNLADRLATQGGSAGEWAQLITALGVLGQTEQAQAIYSEATGVFSADPAALQTLRSAAQSAGIAP